MQWQKSNIVLMRKVQSKRWYHLLAQLFQMAERVNHVYIAKSAGAFAAWKGKVKPEWLWEIFSSYVY